LCDEGCTVKLLILGGTRFLGRHLAQRALEAGHEVTLMHRGRSGPDLFPEAEHRIADRDGSLAVLEDGEWDAAIDTSAYVPRQVHAVAEALAGRVSTYQLVSTVSVYADLNASPGHLTDETAEVQALEDPRTETITGATYGGLKALCEVAAWDGFEGRCLIARPGLLVGPHDPTGRFTWWVERLLRGGEMLAPGDPHAAVQCIDARDAAAWLLHQAEQGQTGVFNLTGPEEPTTMGELLAAGARALNGTAQPVWVDGDFLLAQGVKPWTDLPLWLPRAESGLHRIDIERALATGLQCRAIGQTFADTAAWSGALPPPAADGPPRPPVGLSAAREAALLAAWQAACATP
jgi:2'-hydroxyisoflavone reductase